MIWSVYDYEWKKMYDLAVIYKREKGNLLIPSNYKAEGGVALGAWIGHQRRLYREKKLSDNEIELLNNIGMVWNSQR